MTKTELKKAALELVESLIDEKIDKAISKSKLDSYIKEKFDELIEKKVMGQAKKMRPEALDKLIKQAEEFADDWKTGRAVRQSSVDVNKLLKRGK